MPANIFDGRHKQKTDTYQNWRDRNEVILHGEWCIIEIPAGTAIAELRNMTVSENSVFFKVGDGVTAFNDLPFTKSVALSDGNGGGGLIEGIVYNEDGSITINPLLYTTNIINAGTYAGGIGTIASVDGQTVIGQYNAEDSTALFVVGNGMDDSLRKNIFTVSPNVEGKEYAQATKLTDAITLGFLEEAFLGGEW